MYKHVLKITLNTWNKQEFGQMRNTSKKLHSLACYWKKHKSAKNAKTPKENKIRVFLWGKCGPVNVAYKISVKDLFLSVSHKLPIMEQSRGPSIVTKPLWFEKEPFFIMVKG